MELETFLSFSEMCEFRNNQLEQNKINEIDKLINEILNFSETNEYWIGTILDYLNDLEQEDYLEYFLQPDFYGSREKSYRIISTQNNIPNSITDQDVGTLIKLNLQPQFILYDYKAENSYDPFEYYSKKRTLRLCLASIGMGADLKKYLCELIFNRIKQQRLEEKVLEKKLN